MRRARPSSSSFPPVRINGRIRAREVRVIGPDGAQIGVMSLHEAITLARSQTMDLVEMAAHANPPVCRIVDYGRFRYEQAKKVKESKKHQHANRVKEVQLSASIDPHDFSVKLGHATDFLCEEMKVKISLRFRGREMVHQEFGRQVVQRFIRELAPFGYPPEQPKLVGRNLNAILNPLPRNKRAPNPHQPESGETPAPGEDATANPAPARELPASSDSERASGNGPDQFRNNPFAQMASPLDASSES